MDNNDRVKGGSSVVNEKVIKMNSLEREDWTSYNSLFV